MPLFCLSSSHFPPPVPSFRLPSERSRSGASILSLVSFAGSFRPDDVNPYRPTFNLSWKYICERNPRCRYDGYIFPSCLLSRDPRRRWFSVTTRRRGSLALKNDRRNERKRNARMNVCVHVSRENTPRVLIDMHTRAEKIFRREQNARACENITRRNVLHVTFITRSDYALAYRSAKRRILRKIRSFDGF